MIRRVLAALYTTVLLSQCAVAEIAYSDYILAPSSRTLRPTVVYKTRGHVSNTVALVGAVNGSATFNGSSSVSLDFGKNIGGLVQLKVGSVSSSSAYLGVTFSESSLWVSDQACDATTDSSLDEPLWFPVGQGPGVYAPDMKFARGAFRYLTVVSNTTATIDLDDLTVIFTPAPTQDLRAYTGYFHSDDELLNRIWYAGAYTNQMCTIDPKYGDTLNLIGPTIGGNNTGPTPWWSNTTIANGTSTLTDGAKRDRLVWPGDMAVSLPSIFVSTNDLESGRNGLESLLVLQRSDGYLPYAGVPFIDQLAAVGVDLQSFTYHLHSLGAMYDYYMYSGNIAWLQSHWTTYKAGMAWALKSVDSTGLANVTLSNDWLRFGMGGHNIEANAILYYNLERGLQLAKVLNETTVSNWSPIAVNLKTAANSLLWDASSGLYRDNETTTLHPQDGNAWAVKANLTLSGTQSQALSAALQSRWTPYGAPAPEAGATISPFASAFEIEAHFLAGKPSSALDLIRLGWGFMLDDQRMTRSTFVEGYSTDGSLKYAPYANDPRVSHAHGWSTGPTYALTFFAAGIRITAASGSTWEMKPMMGDLTEVDAGYTTLLGNFSIHIVKAEEKVGYLELTAPRGTVGNVEIPGVEGVLHEVDGESRKIVGGVANGLPGGTWTWKPAH